TLTRALELSQHSEEAPQLFLVLHSLAGYYANRAEYRTALELTERCLRLADRNQDSGLRLIADFPFQLVLAHRGELVQAREYCEQRLTQYDPTLHGALAFHFGMDPGVALTGYAALTAWYLGYPDQALTRGQDTWTLAQDRSHPPSQASGAL